MLQIGIVGTGDMARGHAKRFNELEGCHVAAVYDLNQKSATTFAKKYRAPQVYDDLDKMLENPDLDGISIVTPDASHCEIALKVIASGKAVLCEKPLATHYEDAAQMANAAHKKPVINMVNFSYRRAAALQKAQEIVRSGQIGNIRHVEASYLQGWLTHRVWGNWKTESRWLWRLSEAHGSKGVLGDVGVHILDFVEFPVGAIGAVHCALKTFPKAPQDRLGDYPLDANDSAVLTVHFENGALGTIHMSRWATGRLNSLNLKIYADQGAVEIDLDASETALKLCAGADVKTATFKTIQCPPTPDIYERFVESLRQGVNDQPDFAQGAKIQKILEACFLSHEQSKTVAL